MIVHVFSIVWNEEKLLPYFLRHYETFADKIFIVNDHSTDRTAEIATAHPKVTLLDFPYGNGLHQADFSQCFEDFYKRFSRGAADWVMCVDGDELIYRRDMRGTLKAQREHGVRALKTTGYQMVSKDFPTTEGQIYDQIKTGVRSRGYDKPVVFDPELDVKLGDGRHTIQLPEGVSAGRAQLLLLHYRYLSRDFLIERSKNSYSRIYYDMDEPTKIYRMKRGLDYFDNAINSPLETVV